MILKDFEASSTMATETSCSLAPLAVDDGEVVFLEALWQYFIAK